MSPLAVICTGCGQLTEPQHTTRGLCPNCHAVKEQARDIRRRAQPQRRAHQLAVHKRLRARVFRRDNHSCVYCGATTDLTLDYLLPLQDGGEQTEDNAVTACRSCNSKHGRRTRNGHAQNRA